MEPRWSAASMFNGNSTIECIAGAGLYLKDGSNRAIIRTPIARVTLSGPHIALRGCFLNGNRKHQAGVKTELEDVVATKRPMERGSRVYSSRGE